MIDVVIGLAIVALTAIVFSVMGTLVIVMAVNMLDRLEEDKEGGRRNKHGRDT